MGLGIIAVTIIIRLSLTSINDQTDEKFKTDARSPT